MTFNDFFNWGYAYEMEDMVFDLHIACYVVLMDHCN